jgi:hypothetical protein
LPDCRFTQKKKKKKKKKTRNGERGTARRRRCAQFSLFFDYTIFISFSSLFDIFDIDAAIACYAMLDAGAGAGAADAATRCCHLLPCHIDAAADDFHFFRRYAAATVIISLTPPVFARHTLMADFSPRRC